MKKFIRILPVVLLAVVLTVSFAGVVDAQQKTDLQLVAEKGVKDLDKTQIFETVKRIADAMFMILVILSVFTIFIAAFQFVTAGDNAETLSSARQKLIWAAVGLILALLAFSLPTFLLNIINPVGGA